MIIFSSVTVICLSLLFGQKKHYEQVNNKLDWKSNDALSEELLARLTELDSLKKRMDALTLKIGFKL